MKGPSMRDIAKAVGVSAVTVSNALGGKTGMSDQVREQIVKTAQEMGYINPRPQAMNIPRDIGILIPDRFFVPESYYGMFYKTLVKKLKENGHYSLMELLNAETEKNGELPDLIRNRHVDGLIMLGETSKDYYREIARCGTPVVFLDFYDDSCSADSVVSDNTYGCYRLTAHLIREGHERIGFIGNPHATASIMDRYLGFYRAMLKNRLAIRPEWILNDRDDDGIMREPVLPEELPDAFVCNCDTVAVQLMEQLKDRGLRIPEDISVTGFDDHTVGNPPVPSLSTYRPDTEAMAEIAVKKITERCAGKTGPFEKTVVSGQPVYRESDITRNQQ